MRLEEFHKSFFEHISQNHTYLWEEIKNTPPSTLMLSPTVVPISNQDMSTIRSFIEIMYRLTRGSEYQKRIKSQMPEDVQEFVDYDSVYMSYDFHITESGPKLIEINTNASGSVWVALLTDYFNKGKNFFNYYLEDIQSMFESEQAHSKVKQLKSVLITDEKPSEQKAFSEFLAHKSIFNKFGWKCEIEDVSQLVYKDNKITTPSGFAPDLIYNRHTDFYFQDPISEALRDSYSSQTVIVTPNPKEYALLADKERLLDFSNPNELKKMGATESEEALILDVVPLTRPISSLSRETLKKEREDYFFKPRRSFGGKAVYNGKSISQSKFEQILEQDYIYQKTIKPPTIKTQINGAEAEFKWDLRVYAYQDKVLLLGGRLYQGQTTNSQTPGGGLAAVQIV